MGILRFQVKIEYNNGTEETIISEMMLLVKASNKENARFALVKYFKEQSNGSVLLEARINDTVCGG